MKYIKRIIKFFLVNINALIAKLIKILIKIHALIANLIREEKVEKLDKWQCLNYLIVFLFVFSEILILILFYYDL